MSSLYELGKSSNRLEQEKYRYITGHLTRQDKDILTTFVSEFLEASYFNKISPLIFAKKQDDTPAERSRKNHSIAEKYAELNNKINWDNIPRLNENFRSYNASFISMQRSVPEGYLNSNPELASLDIEDQITIYHLNSLKQEPNFIQFFESDLSIEMVEPSEIKMIKLTLQKLKDCILNFEEYARTGSVKSPMIKEYTILRGLKKLFSDLNLDQYDRIIAKEKPNKSEKIYIESINRFDPYKDSSSFIFKVMADLCSIGLNKNKNVESTFLHKIFNDILTANSESNEEISSGLNNFAYGLNRVATFNLNYSEEVYKEELELINTYLKSVWVSLIGVNLGGKK